MARIKYWDEASQSWKYADKSLKIDNNFLIDKNLIIEGRAADAKATGDAINDTRTYAVEKAAEAVSSHNTNTSAHNDIRLLVDGLSSRINALANSTDEDLDQMAEIVAYIKNNKTLIDSITTSKVSVTDIIDNLTTNVSNRPLSAAQGVALKALIDVLESNKLDASALNAAINTALAQAKASGEFDGEDGYTPVKGEDYYTEADKAEIVEITKNSITPASIGATTLSEIQPLLDKKVNDFSIEIYNGTSGNPKPVRFASFNYSTCDSENGIAAKISLVSGHGNGSSYAFLEDAIIRVNHLGEVEVDNFKYYGTSTGTYDEATRQYGDIFWLVDETNKIADFYCLMGQYARVYQTPWKRLTYSSGGTVTQYTSCTVYSSGEKTWANNSDIVLMSDLTTQLNRTTSVNTADTNYTTLMARGTSLNSAETIPVVNGAIAWTYE